MAEPMQPRDPISHSAPTITEEDIAAVVACLRSGNIKGGELREKLEHRVAAEMGSIGAVATSSGSSAIFLALRALFNGRSAVVGLPSYVCRSVYDAIALAGCRPRLLDIDPDHLSVASEECRRARLDAIVVPHMFGIRAPIERYVELGLPVIEDCAQRLTPPGVETSPALVRIVSFEATKLVTSGEGGLMTTNDAGLLDRARALRDGEYSLREPAVLLPFTDMQAAMALSQWERLAQFLATRRRIARIYLDRLRLPVGDRIHPAMFLDDTWHFRFLLRVDDPWRMMKIAAGRNVMLRRPVAPMPLHELFGEEGSFPESDRASGELISLPLYPSLTDPEIESVVEATVAALSVAEAAE